MSSKDKSASLEAVPNNKSKQGFDGDTTTEEISLPGNQPSAGHRRVSDGTRASDSSASQLAAAGHEETTLTPDEEAKDKNSVATTLTSTLAHSQQSRSSRRKENQSSTSEGELTAASSHVPEKQKVSSMRQKPSSPFSQFLRKLIPCIGPSRSHPIIDVTDVDEKGGVRDTSSTSAAALTVPSSLVPPSIVDPDIRVVPPSPSKQLLPLEETEGVTSGAVQPPGSTGEDHARSHTSMGEETDDEFEDVIEMDAEQEEEDRLIRNGGMGIPVDLVSRLWFSSPTSSNLHGSGWCSTAIITPNSTTTRWS
jgi:hypothetical protein